MGRRKLVPILALALLAGVWPSDAAAQLPGLANRAKRAASNAVKDLLENAVRCEIDDEECAEKAAADGEPTVFVDDDGNVITDDEGNPITDRDEAMKKAGRGDAGEPGTGIWRNYDYTPGHTVIYATDFSTERVGRVPARQIEFVRGNMQIVELDGRRVLEFADDSVLRISLPQALPDDFTVEIVMRAATANAGIRMYTSDQGGDAVLRDGSYVEMTQSPGIYSKSGGPASSRGGMSQISREFTHFKLQVDGEPDIDGDYAILYAGAERVAQLPNARFERGDSLELRVDANQRFQGYLESVVVAVGLDRLYDTLVESGEWVTHGIYFDVDSDRLRPESTPTLTELLGALRQHSDLTLVIEGHTDSTGDDVHNQDLSQRRAASVVEYLVDNGIEAGRLTATGKGESEPVADNDSEAGRQQNRRVVVRVARQ